MCEMCSSGLLRVLRVQKIISVAPYSSKDLNTFFFVFTRIDFSTFLSPNKHEDRKKNQPLWYGIIQH